MKRNFLYVTSALLAALLTCGCKSKPGASPEAETVEIGPKYSATDGLLVPNETRQSLGVKIVEVTEEKVPATLALQMRVYETGKESILTSATVTLEEAKLLRRDQEVRAEFKDSILLGKVTRMNDTFQKATGMAEVLVEFGNASGASVTDAFFPASVNLESEATVVAIPRAALLENSEGHSVYTVSGKHFVRTPVKVGATSGDLVEIKDGLYTGDEVVLQPVMSLWMTELAAVKGGQACCVVPAKGK